MTSSELKWWATELLILTIVAYMFVKLLPLLS